jgi:hypothetical protein
VSNSERGGATSVELALLWSGTLALVLVGVQVAMLAMASQLALSAAEDGLRAGRYRGIESPSIARQAAAAFAHRTAGNLLREVEADAHEQPGGQLTVTVSASVAAVLPALPLTVTRQATGALERPVA